MATESISPDMTTIKPYCRFIELIEKKSNLKRKKFHRTNEGFNFIGESFSKRGNVRAPSELRT